MKIQPILCLLLAGMLSAACIQAQSKADDFKTAAAALEKDFSNQNAHVAFVKNGGPDDPAIIAQYEKWMKKEPRNAGIAFGFGQALSKYESPLTSKWLLRATAIDPKLAEAWNVLSLYSGRAGDATASLTYMRKAMAADPGNPRYLSTFIYNQRLTNPALFKELSYEMVKTFPDRQEAPQTLYWLAYYTPDADEKGGLYERIRKEYPANKYEWTQYAMSTYYEKLMEESPAKALELAREMVAFKSEEIKWAQELSNAEAFVNAVCRLQENKTKEALDTLNTVKLSRSSDLRGVLQLRKAAVLQAGGNTKAAYDSLLYYFAETPRPDVKPELRKLAALLGKNDAGIKEDLRTIRYATAPEATGFTLEQYGKESKLSLADLKGKIVLINYWFPSCGPCRREFPHLENVIRKYSNKEVVYLGINIIQDQDGYVLPFLRSTKYSFIPLRDDPERDRGNMQAKYAPTNYLLDRDGKILYSHFVIDHENEEMLAMMIESLM